MMDEIRFLQRQLPALALGEYEITVEQEVKWQGAALDKFTATRTFSVRGDRLTLKPADVGAVFPPAGSQGDHANVLPHIQLNRSTLPWERRADSGSAETPWLALLLFYEEETPAPQIVRLKDLAGGGARFPALSKEGGQKDDDPVMVIDVPRSVLEGILPAKDELAILTHVRETQNFIVTDRAMTVMQADGVTDGILLKLAVLKDQEFIGRPAFLAALKAALGKDVPEMYYAPISTAAVIPGDSAVVIGNRLPRPQGISTAHLVSVEGRYNANGFDYQGAGEADLIRLISLQSWSFACVDPQQNFIGLLTRLDRTPSTLRLPQTAPASVAPYLAQGATPLWHEPRQGGKMVSWYHGPLTPAANPLTHTDVSAPDFPVRAADELLRYSRSTGMFDVSYAAAWELGRLLALQNKTFSVSLYNWKRAHAQQLRQVEEQILHASPLDAGSTSEGIPLPQEVAAWFKRLSLLEGVPFNYQVPDERLLPLESIRFFQLDWLWIDCLLDGAFSIGRVLAADHQRDGAHANSPAANPHPKVSGLLMRSEVVSGWPGLLVDGFNGEKKLKLLRMDRLSANVLICLFDDQATAVDFHLRPEMAHFELDQKEGNFYKELRDQNGDKSNKTIGPIQLRQTRQNLPQWVVDISRLASAINGNSLPVTSEQFALQMLVTSPKMRFSQSTQTEDVQAH